MFVCEVEYEDVVGLSIDRLLYSVRLVRDERCEEADVAHSSDDVVPVSLSKIEVSFLGEKERGSEPVRRENLRKLA